MATSSPTIGQRIWAVLGEPVDIASLAVFRIMFGLLMLIAVIRVWARGWIESLYLAPGFHFSYWGFEWVQPWPGIGMYLHFTGLAILALCIALGLCYRVATTLFFVGFTYVELLDQATYLNHYYLISLLALLMIGLPLHGAWSLDARRSPASSATVPRYQLLALRLQVGLVYVFAGVAKLQADWLIHAQPLKTWLKAHTELPLIGPWLGLDAVAQGMSFGGALFDLTIPFALLWRVTRVPALVCLIGFHALTGWLFPIGMFPWIMVTCALLLLPPDWPRKMFRCPNTTAHRATLAPGPSTWERIGLVYLLVHFLLQLLVPLRHHLYPGDPSWTEEGGRFAWRVMLTEKVGDVRYRVYDPHSKETHRVDPEVFLTPLQAKEMSVQPDMILAFGQFLAHQYAYPVQVYADAWITLNGRSSARLINPATDLARERESLAPKAWILVREESPRAATAPTQ